MYTPSQAKIALKDLGAQLRMARKRRMWTIADLAKKISVSSPTIIALEKGEPTVSVGVLISTLWILGLDHELRQLTQPHDAQGIQLMNARLPKKVRTTKGSLDNDF
jgi:DNA-binding XRE family transcriptional regulator